MNTIRDWARMPEPKGKYLVVFAGLVFVFLLLANMLLPTVSGIVMGALNLVCVVLAHAIAKPAIARRTKT